MSFQVVAGAERLPAFFTYQDVARRWQCSVATVARLVKRGDLPCVRIGTLVRIAAVAVLTYEEDLTNG